MACRLGGAKPLPEPMPEYCKLEQGANFIEILIEIHTFSFKKMTMTMTMKKGGKGGKGGHFVSASVC